MQRLKASVVGGGEGGNLSMTALANSERFQLVAMTDLREEVCAKWRQKFPQIKTFTSHKEMFKQCPVDVVCVSTWAPSHKQITLDALEMLPLKGILVEKPLGDTTLAGSQILEAIKARKLPMAVPHGLLARTHTAEVLQRVHAGDIGSLRVVEIQNTFWDILNAGIHWLNFAVNALNEPFDWVLAACDTSTRTYRDGLQVETIAVTYAVTKSGARVIMNTGDYVKIDHEKSELLFRLTGTKGRIEFGWGGCEYKLFNSSSPDGKICTVAPLKCSHHQVHLENMAAMIDSGRPDYRIPDSSLAALELCEAAYVSHRHRCKVDLPLLKFTPPAPVDWNAGKAYSGTGGGRDGRKLPGAED